MEPWYAYVIAAAAGGICGGAGHGLMSPDVTFTKRTSSGYDYSGLRDLVVGLLSGLVWLLPNQNLWVGRNTGNTTDLILIALQTMLIGIAGSGWLTSQLSSNTLKGAVVAAASAAPNPKVATQIAQATTTNGVTQLVSTL
jgi:hypothetical protein